MCAGAAACEGCLVSGGVYVFGNRWGLVCMGKDVGEVKGNMQCGKCKVEGNILDPGRI